MDKYCPACGNKIEGESKFCTTCGYSLEGQTSNQVNNQTSNYVNNQNNNQINNTNTNYDINNNFTTYEGVKTYTNGMAIAGLVISIVSFVLCCGSISLIGLIFSIIGLNKAKQNNNVGKGIGIAGLIVNILGMLLFVFWLLLTILPFFAVASEVENYATSIISLLF